MTVFLTFLTTKYFTFSLIQRKERKYIQFQSLQIHKIPATQIPKCKGLHIHTARKKEKIMRAIKP